MKFNSKVLKSMCFLNNNRKFGNLALIIMLIISLNYANYNNVKGNNFP